MTCISRLNPFAVCVVILSLCGVVVFSFWKYALFEVTVYVGLKITF